MYDSPKAAHFIAAYNGKDFAPNDPIGLQIRWSLANRIGESVKDMLRLSRMDMMVITNECEQFNISGRKNGLSVRLDVSCISKQVLDFLMLEYNLRNASQIQIDIDFYIHCLIDMPVGAKQWVCAGKLSRDIMFKMLSE